MRKIGLSLLLILLTCFMWAQVDRPADQNRGGLRNCVVSPNDLNFGSQQLNTQSHQNITVQNVGTATQQVTEISISGNPAFRLDLSGLSALPLNLAAGESIAFQVFYHPTQLSPLGADIATISVVTNSGFPGAGPLTSNVTATGFGAEYGITVTPGAIDFVNVAVGQDHDRQVIFGVGGANPVTITNISFEYGANFEHPSDLPLPYTVPQGGQAPCSVTFSGAAMGYYRDIMIITTDNGSYSVPLSAHAWEPSLSADPATVIFGNSCPLGAVSTQNLSLIHDANSGLSSFRIDNVVLAGDPEFNLSSVIYCGGQQVNLPYDLPDGQSLLFEIQFLPQVAGLRNATVTVYYGGRTLAIPVTAFALGAPRIEVAPQLIYHVLSPNFGATGSLTIYNRGDEDLTFNIDPNQYANAVDFTPNSGTVAPNSELEVTYNISPIAGNTGLIEFNLLVYSNDPDNPTLEVPFAFVTMMPVDNQVFSAYPTQGNLPLTVQFRMIPPTQALRYYWDFDNNGTFDSFEPEPIHTYTNAGVYSVRLVLMLPTGATVQYVMPNYISVGYAGPTVLQNPLSVVYFNQGETGGPYSLTQVFEAPDYAVLQYRVQGSDHITGNVDAWGNLYLNASDDWWGSEVITVFVVDQYGNSASHQITVNVNHVNAAPILNLPADLYFIHRSTYTVDFSQYITDLDDDISNLGITLSYVSGSENIQFVYDPDNQPNVLGQHTVVFSSVSEAAQVARFSLTVNDFHRRAIASAEFNMHVLEQFEAAIGTDMVYQYTGQRVQFLDATLGNPNEWLWEFGDGGSSTEQNPVHIYTNAGAYTVSLTVRHNTANEQDSVTRPAYITMQGTYVIPGALPAIWNPAGSPYNLFNGITFDEGEIFQIMDGVVINVFGDEPLTIEGTLIANNVTFAGPAAGGWAGLVFEGDDRNISSLTSCTIVDAASPLKILGCSPNISGLTINTTDSRDIRDAETAIFIGANSAAQIDSVQIDGYPEGVVIDNEAASGSSTPTLTYIRVRNSTQTSRSGLTGTGLSLKGSATISDVEIKGYDTGIEVKNSNTGTTPTLTYIRVRNSTQTSREEEVKGTTGAKVSGNVIIDSLDVAGYETGVEVKSSENATATPTLTYIRVRNSTQTSREEDNSLGMLIEDGAAPNIHDVEIVDMPRGILIQGDESRFRSTPTLTYIRVRNSSQTSRADKYGLQIKDVENVMINDAEIENYSKGIQIKNSSQTASTPTLTYIRVRNSTQTSRAEGLGIDISGRVEARLNDVLIEDYSLGLKYEGDPEIRATSTPTLTYIRVRNSTQTSRIESRGVQLIDLDKVDLNDVEITDYQFGLEISNTQGYRTTSTPTLTYIRVRNSTQTSRFDNVGILLGNNVGGFLKESLIEEAKVGLMLADGNSTVIHPLKVYNCATGIKAASLSRAKTIKGHYIINEPDFIGEHQDWTFTGFDLMGGGPWKIHNNTLVGMQHYLKANDAQVVFLNNIGTSSPATDQPFIYEGGSEINFNYNNIAIAGQHTGMGNFTADPMFTNALQRDYSLTPFSTCIDAGSPDEPLDSDGTISDIGAYTYLHQAVIQPSHRFILPGTVVQFTNASIGHDYPFTTVEWDLGNDGVVDATSRDWSYQFNETGVYNLKLTMNTGILNDERMYTALVIVQENQLQAPTGVQLSRVEGNFQISWQPVLATTDGTPIEVPYYIVYASSNPYGFFDYVGYTTDGNYSFTDVQAGEASHRFYFVIGFCGTYREMIDFINGNRSLQPGQMQTPTFKSKPETPNSRTNQ